MKWWATRHQTPDAYFTCLLLRVCACSTQHISDALRLKLETELGETTQVLTERYQTAAQMLSDRIQPGAGGLQQVQELYLAATWYKSESLFVESWHALSQAIRVAQEIGPLAHTSLSGDLGLRDR